VGVRVHPLGGRDIDRAGEIIDNRINQVLDALVLECRPADDGDKLVRNGLAANAGLENLWGDRFLLEEIHGNFLIEVRNGANQVVIRVIDNILMIGRDLLDIIGGPHDVVIPVNDRLAIDDIELPKEMILRSQRNEHRPRVRMELLAHRIDGRVKVRPDAVHLINKCNPGNPVLVGLPPDSLRLGLHAGHRVEHRDRAVQHAKGTLDLRREIDVAGGIDDVHPLLDGLENLVNALFLPLRPRTGGGGRGDRNAALALLLHPIGHRGALVHLADLVDHAGVEKDALSERRLARIDVRGDADVAGPLQRKRAVGRIRVRGQGFFQSCGGHGEFALGGC